MSRELLHPFSLVCCALGRPVVVKLESYESDIVLVKRLREELRKYINPTVAWDVFNDFMDQALTILADGDPQAPQWTEHFAQLAFVEFVM
ncbi:unnamed protein product [Vitrella brassicaformis CCMP3155]|uniref:Uncharacterized protein n=1 Tax=Vitrella brassicaformis (strain CCMP3155) TaxID=1169540 RepID=A0A0G4EE72_VITBC|nr:unnamed protein product [Vitrella brassicaformis CCMP3155]|eukprot:CEL94277.1 unnamed protein product [Vitrella brassicaformis CCMP3155]